MFKLKLEIQILGNILNKRQDKINNKKRQLMQMEIQTKFKEII